MNTQSLQTFMETISGLVWDPICWSLIVPEQGYSSHYACSSGKFACCLWPLNKSLQT